MAAWAVTALVIFPLVAAVLTIPDLVSIYMQVDKASLFKICLYGVGWGMAQALLGLAVESIGVALGFSMVLGVSAAMGTLIPLVRTALGVATDSDWSKAAFWAGTGGSGRRILRSGWPRA